MLKLGRRWSYHDLKGYLEYRETFANFECVCNLVVIVYSVLILEWEGDGGNPFENVSGLPYLTSKPSEPGQQLTLSPPETDSKILLRQRKLGIHPSYCSQKAIRVISSLNV
jgi:hypothetical protein